MYIMHVFTYIYMYIIRLRVCTCTYTYITNVRLLFCPLNVNLVHVGATKAVLSLRNCLTHHLFFHLWYINGLHSYWFLTSQYKNLFWYENENGFLFFCLVGGANMVYLYVPIIWAFSFSYVFQMRHFIQQVVVIYIENRTSTFKVSCFFLCLRNNRYVTIYGLVEASKSLSIIVKMHKGIKR